MRGYLPSLIGLSWLAVDITSSLSPFFTSQAQPEPKRAAPAALTNSLSLSNEPNVEVIAAARVPTGLAPALGPMIVQNIEWLICPPPLLRTGPLMLSGTIARLFFRRSSIFLL